MQKCASAQLRVNACFTEESPRVRVRVIAGHRRVQAAKEIGWGDIEGNVVNVNDLDTLYLALKTNLMREDMNEI